MTNSTTSKKLTKNDYYEAIAKMVNGEANERGITPEMVVKFCAHERELLANKNKSSSGEKKMTPTQKANEGYKATIREYLRTASPSTCTGIIKGVPQFTEMAFTPSKVNALLRQLIDAGEVVRSENKGTAYFSLVTIG